MAIRTNRKRPPGAMTAANVRRMKMAVLIASGLRPREAAARVGRPAESAYHHTVRSIARALRDEAQGGVPPMVGELLTGLLTRAGLDPAEARAAVRDQRPPADALCLDQPAGSPLANAITPP